MIYLWTLDGVLIPDLVTAEVTDGYSGFKGTALYNSKLYSSLLEWRAHATPNGYSVYVKEASGRETMWTGSTFNMILEVAMAIKRH